MDSPKISTDYADFYFEEPNILVIRFKKDTDIDETMAVEILGQILKLTKGEAHAIIYDFNRKNVIIREISRKISGLRDERLSKMICRAFIATSLQNKLESKHYIQAGKPSAETKYFFEKEEALRWVREKIDAYFKKNTHLFSDN